MHVYRYNLSSKLLFISVIWAVNSEIVVRALQRLYWSSRGSNRSHATAPRRGTSHRCFHCGVYTHTLHIHLRRVCGRVWSEDVVGTVLHCLEFARLWGAGAENWNGLSAIPHHNCRDLVCQISEKVWSDLITITPCLVQIVQIWSNREGQTFI